MVTSPACPCRFSCLWPHRLAWRASATGHGCHVGTQCQIQAERTAAVAGCRSAIACAARRLTPARKSCHDQLNWWGLPACGPGRDLQVNRNIYAFAGGAVAGQRGRGIRRQCHPQSYNPLTMMRQIMLSQKISRQTQVNFSDSNNLAQSRKSRAALIHTPRHPRDRNNLESVWIFDPEKRTLFCQN